VNLQDARCNNKDVITDEIFVKKERKQLKIIFERHFMDFFVCDTLKEA